MAGVRCSREGKKVVSSPEQFSQPSPVYVCTKHTPPALGCGF